MLVYSLSPCSRLLLWLIVLHLRNSSHCASLLTVPGVRVVVVALSEAREVELHVSDVDVDMEEESSSADELKVDTPPPRSEQKIARKLRFSVDTDSDAGMCVVACYLQCVLVCCGSIHVISLSFVTLVVHTEDAPRPRKKSRFARPVAQHALNGGCHVLS